MTKQEFHAYYLNQMNRTFVVDAEEFNLLERGWTPTYGNTKRALGRCVYSRNNDRVRRIEISNHYLSQSGQNWETMKDTVLHEIAHAIDVEQRGYSNHDSRWKSIARQVGADPTRTADDVEAPEGKYTLICDSCGHTSPAFRKHTRRKACSKCCNANGGGFQERFVMRQVVTATGQEVGYEPSPRRRRKTNDWFPTMGF